MNDSTNRPKNTEELWQRQVNDARKAFEEAKVDDYFMGIFDGCMASLAVLASYLGRMREYVALCNELDGFSLTFGAEDVS